MAVIETHVRVPWVELQEMNEVEFETWLDAQAQGAYALANGRRGIVVDVTAKVTSRDREAGVATLRIDAYVIEEARHVVRKAHAY